MSRKHLPILCIWTLHLIFCPALMKTDNQYTENERSYCEPKEVYDLEPAVKVFTVATEDTHGLQRFLRSTKMHGIDVEILGMGQKWDGGNMKNPGGGQKVKLLKQKILSMQKLPDREQIIIFTDSYDVMYLADLNVIVDKFKSMDVRVLFAAEPFCWPDASLAKKYPNTTVTNPYLNSGGIIGYLPELKKILNMKEIANRDDDQLFFTEAYLNEDLRLTYHLALDHKSEIFQNLHGALSDIKLITNSTTECPYLVNLLNNARPLIVHGNGPSKITLNHFSNYLNHAWSVTDGCTLCEEKRIELNEDKLPTVMIAVFVEQTTPFMEEFLQQLVDIDYPKNKIHFYLHNSVEYHGTDIDDFFRAHSVDYLSAKCIKPSDFISEGEARNIAKGRCVNTECDYLLSIDSLSRVDPSTLRYLITTGYDVVAPLLLRTGQSWSNFWGAINSAGYYARSTDYMDIVNRKIIGIWNVPFIANIYLINMELFRKESLKEVSYLKDELDADMAFCSELRDHGVMMHVSNEKVLGHLINPESYDVSRKNPDIYQVMDNQEDWEQRYLHAEYFDSFDDGRNHSMLGKFKTLILHSWMAYKQLRVMTSTIPLFNTYVRPLAEWNIRTWYYSICLMKYLKTSHEQMYQLIFEERLRNQNQKQQSRRKIVPETFVVARDFKVNWKWVENFIRKPFGARSLVERPIRQEKPFVGKPPRSSHMTIKLVKNNEKDKRDKNVN
ncbi:procollagen-lysine,2-oxoglutarate 5-dioxygenase 1 isoform X3 [Pararge aegeria]|uniref:procollagen-lysine,2-oxoglutarate 5-dioxygenase 1 isoform X3 n=1 Tax=Pararge aegeria TaxID=116150 RepID=UPI0019D31659|nr:procollagen-lysine,2-oxoglutarate 5-dioxygenase 1 isoform X3 [Pararge aegeria]